MPSFSADLLILADVGILAANLMAIPDRIPRRHNQETTVNKSTWQKSHHSKPFISICDCWKGGNKGGKRFRVRVWLGPKRGYSSRRFCDETRGAEWAREQLRIGGGNPRVGESSLEDLLNAYLQQLVRQKSCIAHQNAIARHCRRLLDAGITDLQRPDATQIVNKYLSTATEQPKGGGGGVSKQHETESPQTPISPSLHNKIVTSLRAVYNHAVDNHLISKNYLDGLKFIPVKAKLRPVFTVDEIRILLAPKMWNDPWYVYVLLAFFLGARPSELRNLKWRDVSFQNRYVTIPEYVPGNKSGQARDVYLQDEVIGILKHFLGRLDDFLVGDHVHEVGDSSLSKAFEGYCRRAGVPILNRRPYATRHSWCAMMVATGETTLAIQIQAGHTSSNITAGYAREATKYRHQVADWKRGQFQLLSLCQLPPRDSQRAEEIVPVPPNVLRFPDNSDLLPAASADRKQVAP